MNKTLLIIFLLLPLQISLAAAKDKKKSSQKPPSQKIEILAEATLSTADKDILLGDSVVLSITLYSDQQFLEVKNRSNKQPTIKRCALRKFNAHRQLRQSVVSRGGRRYYAVVAEQYILKPEDIGSFCLKKQEFDVVVGLLEKKQQPYDPFFDDFFSFGSPFGQQLSRVKLSCTAAPLRFKVSKRPPRTIEQIKKSGAQVM